MKKEVTKPNVQQMNLSIKGNQALIYSYLKFIGTMKLKTYISNSCPKSFLTTTSNKLLCI